MTASDSDPDVPLDPEMARVERKLRRLLAVSGLIMAAGLVAVFAAIFYRLAQRAEPPPPEPPAAATAPAPVPLAGPAELDLAIPAGAVLRGAALAGDRLLVTLDLADGSAAVWIVRLADGGIEKRVRLSAP